MRASLSAQCMAQAILEASGGDRKVPGVTNVMAIVMAGMTKVFVGEITAEGERAGTSHGPACVTHY